MKKIETIAIVGAGALGVMFGQRLTSQLGKDRVCFAVDAKRAERYQTDGFTCNGEACNFRYAVPAQNSSPAGPQGCSPDGAVNSAPVDLVLFTVKFTGIEEAIALARPLIGPDTVVISLLNGIASEDVLAEAYGEQRVLYCVAQGMDAMKEGNRVSYENMGELLVGPRVSSQEEMTAAVKRVLEEGQVPVRTPENIRYSLWNKLMLNTGVNQTVAVYGGTYGTVQEEGEPRRTMLAAMEEVRQVAGCEGVALTEEDIHGWMALLGSLNPEGMPSLRQDTKAHRKTEVELFSGTICQLGRKHGLSTPVNDFLYRRIREIEAAY